MNLEASANTAYFVSMLEVGEMVTFTKTATWQRGYGYFQEKGHAFKNYFFILLFFSSCSLVVINNVIMSLIKMEVPVAH